MVFCELTCHTVLHDGRFAAPKCEKETRQEIRPDGIKIEIAKSKKARNVIDRSLQDFDRCVPSLFIGKRKDGSSSAVFFFARKSQETID